MRQTIEARRKHTGTAILQALTLAGALAVSLTASAAQSPSENLRLTKPQAERRIVVSIPDRKLALLENGRVVKVYSVAVGAPESPSPVGEFQITQRLERPAYYRPGVVIGPGAGNPLGTRWMALNVKGFGIHGTNRPDSVGKNSSHGCIRLRNGDVEDLFARVRAGDHVSLLGERNEEVARLFGNPSVPADRSQTLAARNATAAERDSEARGDE